MLVCAYAAAAADHAWLLRLYEAYEPRCTWAINLQTAMNYGIDVFVVRPSDILGCKGLCRYN
jgi:hypothetical protein